MQRGERGVLLTLPIEHLSEEKELLSLVRRNRAILGCHPVLGQQCMTMSTRARAFAEQIFLLDLKYEMNRGLPCIHWQAAYESAGKRRAMKESCSKCDLPFPPLSNAKGSPSSIHSRMAPYQPCSLNYKSTDARYINTPDGLCMASSIVNTRAQNGLEAMKKSDFFSLMPYLQHDTHRHFALFSFFSFGSHILTTHLNLRPPCSFFLVFFFLPFSSILR